MAPKQRWQPQIRSVVQKAGRNHSMQKVDNPAMSNPPFLYFLPNPTFWQDFSDNIAPLKHEMNTQINSCGKVISSLLED